MILLLFLSFLSVSRCIVSLFISLWSIHPFSAPTVDHLSFASGSHSFCSCQSILSSSSLVNLAALLALSRFFSINHLRCHPCVQIDVGRVGAIYCDALQLDHWKNIGIGMFTHNKNANIVQYLITLSAYLKFTNRNYPPAIVVMKRVCD